MNQEAYVPAAIERYGYRQFDSLLGARVLMSFEKFTGLPCVDMTWQGFQRTIWLKDYSTLVECLNSQKQVIEAVEFDHAHPYPHDSSWEQHRIARWNQDWQKMLVEVDEEIKLSNYGSFLDALHSIDEFLCNVCDAKSSFWRMWHCGLAFQHRDDGENDTYDLCCPCHLQRLAEETFVNSLPLCEDLTALVLRFLHGKHDMKFGMNALEFYRSLNLYHRKR